MKKHIKSAQDLDQEVADVIARTPHATHIHPCVHEIHEYITQTLKWADYEVLWFYRKGLPSRSVWLIYKSVEHYFRYNPVSDEIEWRKGGRLGPHISSFSKNDTSVGIVKKLKKYFP